MQVLLISWVHDCCIPAVANAHKGDATAGNFVYM